MRLLYSSLMLVGMDASDTFTEYREMFRKAGFRGRSLYPLAALRNGCDLRKVSQR